jgi:hypothetical protein
VHPSGWAEFANATVRGTVYADTGWFKGQIIGGNATTYASGTGMWTGVDAGTWKFRLGSSDTYLRWDGASLTLRGTLTIEDGSGNVLLSSGTGIPWDRISSRPADAAILNEKARANANLVRSLKTWAHGGNNWITSYSVHTEDGHTLVIPSGQNYVPSNSPVMNLSDGTEWVISFIAWSSSPRTLLVDLFPDTLPRSVVVVTNEYRKQYSFVWSSSHPDRSNCTLRFFAGTEPGQIEIGEIKLERGNVRTIWTPHFTDALTVSNPITPSNVTTYIASAAIGNAQIGGDIWSSNHAAGSAGWRIYRSGNAEFRNITARGDIEASSLKANTAMVNRANIVNAAVDTLQIAGNAVTIPVAASGTSSCQTPSVNFNSASLNIIVTGNSDLTSNSTSSTSGSVYLDLYRNGGLIGSWRVVYYHTDSGSRGGSVTAVFQDNPGAGAFYYTAVLRLAANSSFTASSQSVSVLVIGTRR